MFRFGNPHTRTTVDSGRTDGELGLLTTIHQDSLTPQKLLESILSELGSDRVDRPTLDLAALPTLTGYVSMMLSGEYEPAQLRRTY